MRLDGGCVGAALSFDGGCVGTGLTAAGQRSTGAGRSLDGEVVTNCHRLRIGKIQSV